MADIDLIRPHSLPIAEARARVQKTADELAIEHDLSSEWSGNILRFDRTGLHGEMHVTPSEVRLQVNLGFLLKPLKGTFLSEIERKLDRLFPATKSGAQAKKPARKTAPTA
jgi:putative polyhydroxyalkanoate system protein